MLEYELVDANGVHQGIQKVRVEHATRSAVGTCKKKGQLICLHIESVSRLYSVRSSFLGCSFIYCDYINCAEGLAHLCFSLYM